jgi:hypothetical protein
MLIVEGNDGSFIIYPTNMNIHDDVGIDIAIDKFIVQLRKEKLQKLNEIQA